jgi:hypothetical protein
MPPSTGDDDDARRREAVERELRRADEPDDGEDRDLVDTVGDEQRREREALDEDDA